MKRRYPLTVQQAKQALKREERKLVRRGDIDSFRIVSYRRTSPKRIRFYVKERSGGFEFDGHTGVWLRGRKIIIRYPSRPPR